VSTVLPLDLQRYPIDELDGPAARPLIEECRTQLDRDGLCLLPGFLAPAEVARVVAEAEEGLPEAFHKQRNIVAMNEHEIDPAAPEDDLLRKAHRHSMQVITTDRIGPDSPIRALYEWDGFARFLSEVLDQPVYVCADPLISLVVTAMPPGGEQGWHFDDNDFVVSLLLQMPEDGGRFEYAPMIRSDDDPGWDRIRAVFAGTSDEVKVAPIEPGTLALFRGERSVHRVSPVLAGPTRMIALLSYDRRPGMVFPAKAQLNNSGRTSS
jgi:phytanoyl-CoA dioxygenase PhyH